MDFHFSAIFAPWDKCKFASRFIIAAVNENHAVSDSFFEKFSVISVFCASLVPELARTCPQVWIWHKSKVHCVIPKKLHYYVQSKSHPENKKLKNSACYSFTTITFRVSSIPEPVTRIK